MKSFILMGLLAFNTAHARNIIGNGGGVWACKASPAAAPTQLMQVDIFEAREQQNWAIQNFAPMLNADGVVADIMAQVERDLPAYAPLWKAAMEHVRAVWQPAGGELELTEDALYVLKPYAKNCMGGIWTYTQFANFTLQDQLLVDKELWASPLISEMEKAALIWHETIYLWLRQSYQDTNSVRARILTGLLFSTETATVKNAKIAAMLQVPEPSLKQDWFCSVNNNKTKLVYAAYAGSEFEAKHNAIAACKNAPDDFFCENEMFVKCEQLHENRIAWACTVDNNFISREFIGRGRGQLEAEFRAKENCIFGSPERFASNCNNPWPECTEL